ncbi:LysM peptidoglycan-binding domain-containing protein [Propionivibrio limicola]|uniref:LysM peptidoglycan-binding domain-containing protein n=1 Tax=Propionivibrio limicola TaxID=167645 RepID=UPI0014784D65|nr:LysM peptidoglycan-binding domain-containing protein [Propionivibrio limicola]
MTLRIFFAMAGLALATSHPAMAVDLDTGESSLSSSLTLSPRGAEGREPPITLAALSQASAGQPLPVVEIPVAPATAETIDLTADTSDLFERVRMGFAMPDIYNDLVLHHMQYYQNRPDYLRRMVERGRLYMHHIVEELERRGMPTELALLPMVESAFNPTAYSRSHASGLWQFIPATGKRYKLDQDWWKDERRDIVASTSAALDYLQSIYEMHGDWHLALASYNWGEGAVGRAIAKNRAQGLPTDYLSLTMPAETRNYVPKLQALKNIFSDPALMAELRIPRVPNQPYFGTVTRNTDIDIKVAAKLAEMPVQEFVALNPAHNRPVIQSDTPMVIPAEKLDTFINNLEEHENSNKPLSSWQAYTLRPGDKLEKVAPRFGMTVANLRAVNGLNGKIKPKPGLTLLVAGNDGSGSLDALPDLPEQPVVAEPKEASAPAPRAHTVRKGDTLPAIAKRYGMTVAEIKKLNKLKSGKLTAGARLQLAAEKPSKKTEEKQEKVVRKAEEKSSKAGAQKDDRPAKQANKSGKEKDTAKSSKVARYTVKPGDTIYSIAKRFNVGTNDLMRTNRITPATLKPGKTLTIQLARND